jgi:hypothetical protein
MAAVESELSSRCVTIVDRIANDLKDAIGESVVIRDASGVPITGTSEGRTVEFSKTVGFEETTTVKYDTYYDPSIKKTTIRRTEVTDDPAPNNIQIQYLTDSLATMKIQKPNPDKWAFQIEVVLERPYVHDGQIQTRRESRTTMVQTQF